MKNIITFLLIAFTITNAIFIFVLHKELVAHKEVINRQGALWVETVNNPSFRALFNSTTTDQN